MTRILAILIAALICGDSANAGEQGYRAAPQWLYQLPSPLGNNGVFVTDGSGNPSISTTLSSGLTIPQINDGITTLTVSGSSAGLSNSAFYGNVATVNGTYSGAQPTAVYTNQINSVNVNSPTSLENTRIYTNLGGASQIGGFINFDTTLFVNSAITNDPTNEFYQASNVASIAQVNVGGTGGAPLGHLFSDGHYARLKSGATNWWSVWGDEYDISIASGASAKLAGGVSVVLLTENAVAPTQEFPAFLVSAQSGATPTITCGYCFTGYEGNNGLASGASLMALSPHGGSGSYPQATITNGIDLNLIATTGFAWRGPNATSTIDGSGNATVNNVTCAVACKFSNVSWTVGSQAANLTQETVPNGSGANVNIMGIVGGAAVFNNLYARVPTAPGAGQTVTFTLFTGTNPAALSASNITCQISGASATTCNDTTHSVNLAAGSYWYLQIVTSASAASTGQMAVGFQSGSL